MGVRAMNDKSGKAPDELIGTWRRNGEVRDYYRVNGADEVTFFYLVRATPEGWTDAGSLEQACGEVAAAITGGDAGSGGATDPSG